MRGEKEGTRYCFAWLTHDELSELQQKASLVTWWLELLHAESTSFADSREKDEAVSQVCIIPVAGAESLWSPPSPHLLSLLTIISRALL